MRPQAATATQSAKMPEAIKQSATGDVFDRIQQIYGSTARRAFEIFVTNGSWLGNDLEDWFRAESELLHPLQLEMTESDENLTVRAEVPGFGAKELEISVEPRRLTILGKHEAQKESKKAKTIYSGRCAKRSYGLLTCRRRSIA